MQNLIEKLSSYNLFNYLLPGVLFIYFLDILTPYSFIQEDLIIGFFVYYFAGLVISRLGSLFVESSLKKVKFLKFKKYSDFIRASQKDSKLEILSESNNMYRTLCSVFFLLFLFKLYEIFSQKWLWLHELNTYVLVSSLFILFLFSYKKQTRYITERVETILED